MTGFELRTSGIGSNRSTNCTTTTATFSGTDKKITNKYDSTFVIYDHGSFIILGIDVISLIIPRVRLLPVHLLPKKMRSIDSIEFYYMQFSSQ